LLVVGPKNAFTAWDEEIPDCLENFAQINAHVNDFKSQSYSGRMVRLTGGLSNIKNLLQQSPDCCIISYQQLSNSDEIIEVVSKYLLEHKVFCALDESHRIKGIYGPLDSPGTQARAVLSISPFCEFRYVMSGTPMPQWEGDLYNQYKFLNPLTRIDWNGVYNEIKDLYVRTNKHDLGIPEFKTEILEVPMSKDQHELYEKVRNVEKRKYLESTKSNKLRNLKRSVMRMLQLSSNPRIINDIEFYNLIKDEGLNSLIEESSTKFKATCALARKIAGEGEKVLIWSGFKGNIKLLLEELVDLNPVEVDGSTFSGDEEEVGTRDYNIKKFKTDPSCMVMIANPAAASEGISLHIDRERNPLCKNAIYLDRNFNAAQFIQSVDRIHRLGITWNPNVYILKTKYSMDSRVQERLDEKIEALQKLLDDPSLSPYLSIDPTLNEDEFVLDEQSSFTLSPEDQTYYENELLRD
jgi:SNF2 family DNA or RNA helicase